MFNHILVAVDGSDHANRAIDIASDLAKQNDARLTLLHVQESAGSDSVPKELERFAEIEQIRATEREMVEREGRRVLEHAETQARGLGAGTCETVLEHGDAASRVVAVAKDSGVDLIVLGRRGLGDLGGLLLGSVSHKVGQAVECCCMTVK